MASYLLAAVALAVALLKRSWAPMVRAFFAVALGMSLAAAYLIPAAWEQRWVDITQAINDPFMTIENNWLFGLHSKALPTGHNIAQDGVKLRRANRHPRKLSDPANARARMRVADSDGLVRRSTDVGPARLDRGNAQRLKAVERRAPRVRQAYLEMGSLSPVFNEHSWGEAVKPLSDDRRGGARSLPDELCEGLFRGVGLSPLQNKPKHLIEQVARFAPGRRLAGFRPVGNLVTMTTSKTVDNLVSPLTTDWHPAQSSSLIRICTDRAMTVLDNFVRFRPSRTF